MKIVKLYLKILALLLLMISTMGVFAIDLFPKFVQIVYGVYCLLVYAGFLTWAVYD